MSSNGSGKYNNHQFRLARLYRKTSQKGTTYYTGRLGGARITLLNSRDTAEDGGEIWDLLASGAPAPKQHQEASANQNAGTIRSRSSSNRQALRNLP